MDIENLQKEKGRLIDSAISDVFKGDIPNLHDAIRYHMDTGGKRLRPLLAIMTYEALTGKNDARSAPGSEVKKIIPFAAACEVLHNWILVHDDIEDGDKVRRDKPTVWVHYGLSHGVNIGDYMAHKVFELILKTRDQGVKDEVVFKLIKAMNDTALKTAEGQTMDMNLRASDTPTEKQYLEMIVGKTAHYLTVPMVGAAIVAKKEDLIPKLIEFGRSLGPAFQITDDVLDLTEGKGRGEIGRDIKEGKRSILVIHCLGRCNKDEKTRLLYMLNKSPEETSEKDVLYIKSLFEKYRSIDYAQKMAEDYTKKAKSTADNMPPRLRDILYFFADYSVRRKK